MEGSSSHFRNPWIANGTFVSHNVERPRHSFSPHVPCCDARRSRPTRLSPSPGSGCSLISTASLQSNIAAGADPRRLMREPRDPRTGHGVLLVTRREILVSRHLGVMCYLSGKRIIGAPYGTGCGLTSRQHGVGPRRVSEKQRAHLSQSYGSLAQLARASSSGRPLTRLIPER